jgi:hypothetical protein
MPNLHRIRSLAMVAAMFAAAALVAGCGDDDDTGTTITAQEPTTADVDAEICSTLTQLQSEVEEVNSLSSSDINAQVISNEVDQVTKTVDRLASEAKEASSEIKDQVTSAVETFKSDIGDIPEQSVPQALITLGTALGTLEKSIKDVSSEAGC